MWTRSCYDPHRLAEEWRDARWSALASFVNASVRQKGELAWLVEVSPSARVAVLEAVFREGKRLGTEVRRRIGREPTLGEIVHLISRAETGCFEGKWKSADAGATRYHCLTCCPFGRNEFDCDYWREAARGLVSGLSDSVELSRYDSIGHGGERCLDVLYERNAVDRRYGPIPEEVSAAVAHLLEDLNRWEVTLELLGFNEGTLYYKVLGRHFHVCPSCRSLVASELGRALDGLESPVRVEEVGSEPPASEPFREREAA